MCTRSRRLKQVFLNPDCQSTDSCDLKRFTLSKAVNEIWFSDNPKHPTYGNGVIMEYETDSVAALETYAIVQFKKGCVFDTAKTSEGKIRRIVTRHGGELRRADSFLLSPMGDRFPGHRSRLQQRS